MKAAPISPAILRVRHGYPLALCTGLRQSHGRATHKQAGEEQSMWLMPSWPCMRSPGQLKRGACMAIHKKRVTSPAYYSLCRPLATSSPQQSGHALPGQCHGAVLVKRSLATSVTATGALRHHHRGNPISADSGGKALRRRGLHAAPGACCVPIAALPVQCAHG